MRINKCKPGVYGRGILKGFFFLLTVGCGKQDPAHNGSTSTATASDDALSTVLATVAGGKITMADVRERVGEDLDRGAMQYAQFRSTVVQSTLDDIVRERVIREAASKQGKTYDQLVAEEAGPGGLNPSEAEIADWYNANAARIGNRSFGEVKSQIGELLHKQRQAAAEENLRTKLIKEFDVKVNFEPYRLVFDNSGAPALGNAGAPVTLVEFSDFQCPFCRHFASTIKQVAQKYGDNVRIVYRQFPIESIHPFAPKAAEASLCANEQGKFWELHDAMFTDQTKLSVDDLKATATRIGMNTREFVSCVESGRFAPNVQADLKEGARVGVTGTPAIFVNGVELKGGAVPFENVARAIDTELARSSQK